MERKKVLHILASIMPSGAETMLENSGDLWDGYDKYALATCAEPGTYIHQMELAGYEVVHFYNRNWWSQHRMIRKYIRKQHFDVIHIHRESQSLLFALDAKICKIKHIVRTVHCCFAFRGVLRVRRIVTRWMERVMGVKYVAIGESVFDTELVCLHNRCKSVINNWCNEKVYKYVTEEEKQNARKRLGIPDGTMALVSIGNCNATKNHRLLLHALAEISKDSPVPIVYYHVGRGCDEDEEKKLAEQLSISDMVHFVGHTKPQLYLQASDLYVMPSVYEGFGISALEAFMSGVPALLTDVSGLRDFKELDDSQRLICFSTLSEKDFAACLGKMVQRFSDGTLHNSKELSDSVQKRFSMRSSVSEYLKIYEE